MESCIFCRIASGGIPAYKVCEDERTLAFLDRYPLAKGHTLIIPKLHVERVEQLSVEWAEALFGILPRIVGGVQRAVGAPSSLIGIHNGRESGQEVPHLHIHIVPRFAGDGGGTIHSTMKARPRLGEKEMKEIAEIIKKELESL